MQENKSNFCFKQWIWCVETSNQTDIEKTKFNATNEISCFPNSFKFRIVLTKIFSVMTVFSF